MSEYRWCLFKNGEADPIYVWYKADEVDVHNLPEDFRYHRTDGPFAKGPRDDGPFAKGPRDLTGYGWWLDGEAYTFDKWLKLNRYLLDEEKALLILEFA